MMEDPHRVHPVPPGDPEAPPTTPLERNRTVQSEKGSRTPMQQHRTRSTPPLHPPGVPPIHATTTKRGSCLCKCICWTVSLIILLLIIIGATIGILYLVFNPKIPNYSVDSLRISNLQLNLDATLYAEFKIKVKATNPNKKIGIYYEKDGKLMVYYTNTKLCEGSIPVFYQGHQNTTKLDVRLTGRTQYGSTLMSAIQEQQQTGRIPLDLKVKAPIAIKLGKLKLMKVKVLGDCLLAVNSLTTNSLISIKASNCKFRLKL